MTRAHLRGALVCIALVGAVIGSLGAPLITSVATSLDVGLDAAQWTLTVTLFAGAMAVLGFGVGGVSAVMPRLVLGGVPPAETASVLTINQIVRSIGYSIGSAVAGVLLATATAPSSLLPTEHGYIVAALWSIVPLAVSATIVLARPRR